MEGRTKGDWVAIAVPMTGSPLNKRCYPLFLTLLLLYRGAIPWRPYNEIRLCHPQKRASGYFY